jgi:MinD superfamily P-loop ATPase
MSFFITSECINCGECLVYCEVAAIVDGGNYYTIDQKLCNKCGVCPSYCPTNAIKES